MGIIKRKIRCRVRIRWKKCKILIKRSYRPKTFANSNKKSKTQFFCHFFAWVFCNFFNGFEISIFFIPILHFWKIIFSYHISTFFKLWSQKRTKRLKKTKNVFFQCVLELNQRPGRAKLLKYCALMYWIVCRLQPQKWSSLHPFLLMCRHYRFPLWPTSHRPHPIPPAKHRHLFPDLKYIRLYYPTSSIPSFFSYLTGPRSKSWAFMLVSFIIALQRDCL
jgi:hypothetical protein